MYDVILESSWKSKTVLPSMDPLRLNRLRPMVWVPSVSGRVGWKTSREKERERGRREARRGEGEGEERGSSVGERGRGRMQREREGEGEGGWMMERE